MRIYHLLLFLAFASLLSLNSCAEKTAQELFSDYESFYKRGEMKKANKAVDNLIKTDTTSALLYNARGLSRIELEQYDAAIEDFNKAIELENENILAFTKRGEAKSLKGDYLDAIEDFKQAIVFRGFKPVNDTVFDYNLVNKEILEEPLLFDIVYLRGIAYYNIFELYLAFDDFNLCIEASLNASIDSKFNKIPECYYWRGLTFRERNEINLACADLHIAAESGITQALKDIEELCK